MAGGGNEGGAVNKEGFAQGIRVRWGSVVAHSCM